MCCVRARARVRRSILMNVTQFPVIFQAKLKVLYEFKTLKIKDIWLNIESPVKYSRPVIQQNYLFIFNSDTQH